MKERSSRGAPDEICRRYNHQKKIDIHLTSGEDIELDHKAGSAEMITRLLEQGMLETIHAQALRISRC